LAAESSEDLLTWNVFSYLEDTGALENVLPLIGIPKPAGDVLVFYWGANDRYPFPDNELGQILIETFGEHPNRLSEPDVMLVGPHTLAIVEAKLGSMGQLGKPRGICDRARRDADRFDVGPGHGLAVRDDRQRLKRRAGQPLGSEPPP